MDGNRGGEKKDWTSSEGIEGAELELIVDGQVLRTTTTQDENTIK